MIAKTSILLVEPEIGWVKVDYKRWRPALELLEYVALTGNYR